MKSGSIWSQIPSQKTSPGGLSFVYQTIIAPHTGQSSQLVVDAKDGNSQFLPNLGGAEFGTRGTRASKSLEASPHWTIFATSF
jgi:hypothetical protein